MVFTEIHQRSELAQRPAAVVPVFTESHAQNFDTVTVVRLQEIAERNRIRQEAGLPLLSISKELRRMKGAADAEKFRKFTDVYRKKVYHRMVDRERRRTGDPNWAPTGVLSGGGLGFGAEVDGKMRKLYRRISASSGWEARPQEH